MTKKMKKWGLKGTAGLQLSWGVSCFAQQPGKKRPARLVLPGMLRACFRAA